MELILEVSARVARLQFDPVQGRRTFYAKITVGPRTWWVQRWDTERCTEAHAPGVDAALGTKRPRIFARSRDGLMCWTAGNRTTKGVA